MKFQGSNFQSWSDFDLEISGLTVVTGVSNRGKSALFRALQGLLRNEIAAGFVRLGQKLPLELTLKYGDHEIKAKRPKDSSTTYKIDGKPFTSLARQIPEDLKKLGFSEIKIGEFTVDPIFSSQFDPLFLLEKKAYSPGMLNAILGAFGGTEKLELGKKEANLRITQKNGEAKTLSLEIAEANARANKLQELSDKGMQIAISVHALEASARRLEARAAWTTLTHQRMNRLARIADIGKRLEVPDTSEVGSLQIKLACLQTVGPAQYRVQALSYIETVLGRVTTGWSETVKLYKKAAALNEVLPVLKRSEAEITKVGSYLPPAAIVGRLEEELYSTVNLRASIRVLADVKELLARVENLTHERLKIEAQQDAAVKLKCPQCGAEF